MSEGLGQAAYEAYWEAERARINAGPAFVLPWAEVREELRVSWSAAAQAAANAALSLPYLHALVMARYGLPATEALRMADRIWRDIEGPHACGTDYSGGRHRPDEPYSGGTGEFAEMLTGWGVPVITALAMPGELARTALYAALGVLRDAGKTEFTFTDLETFRTAHGRSRAWVSDVLAELEAGGKLRLVKSGAWAFTEQEAKR